MPPPSNHRIPEELSKASLQRRQESAQRNQSQYIGGRIPTWWIKRAAMLPGKSLAVGLVIWFLRGVTRSTKDLVISTKRVAEYGVSRKSRHEALKALESGGLIRVDKRRGRSPRVTLLLADVDASTSRRC